MIDSNKYFLEHQYPEDFKRRDLIQSLKEEVQNERNLRICIQSETTASNVLEIVEDALVD